MENRLKVDYVAKFADKAIAYLVSENEEKLNGKLCWILPPETETKAGDEFTLVPHVLVEDPETAEDPGEDGEPAEGDPIG